MEIASILSDQAQKFIQDHQSDDPSHLMLHQKGVPGVPLRDLVIQIKARAAIKRKVPSWHAIPQLIFGESKSYEQCSSEQTAIYKAGLVSGNRLLDLTGGLGVDSFFVGKNFNQVTYVERDPQLCLLAAHNFKILAAKQISVIQGESEKVLSGIQGPIDWIYLDPDRRRASQRKYFLEDCSPSIVSLLPELWKKTEKILLKLSPLLDLQRALDLLKHTSQVHAISIKNDCKELLVVLEKQVNQQVKFTAVNIPGKTGLQRFTFSKDQEIQSVVNFSEPRKFLYEPNSSIMKLGAFKLTCQRYGLFKLHPNSHLYTSDLIINDFPGRSFEVQWTHGYKPGQIGKMLASGKANIVTRNFIKEVRVIRKECKIADGGEDFLFATTGPEGKPIIINGHRLE